MPDIIYKTATTEEDFGKGKQLFREYSDSLGVDLSFQDFEKELSTIQLQYNANGCLFLVFDGDQAIGCAGVRKLDGETAELKRMYVKDGYRGLKIGVHLLERCIEKSGELGYKKMRLDTLASMTRAQELYRSFGFYEISSYRFNPLEGTVYMEKVLAPSAKA